MKTIKEKRDISQRKSKMRKKYTKTEVRSRGGNVIEHDMDFQNYIKLLISFIHGLLASKLITQYIVHSVWLFTTPRYIVTCGHF